MKNFIVAFVVSAVLLSCATEQSNKLDVVGQINKNIMQNPSAAGGTGTNYYVCDDGDDANDGLSEETPWKSLETGISKFKTMETGDAVLLCRGGVFTALSSFYIANWNCRADNPCILSDYYNPVSQVEDASPVILSQHSGYVFRFQDGGNADHDEGYLLENFNLKAQAINTGTGFFFYNDVDDVHLENITISLFDVGIYVAGANTPNEGSNIYNERITASNVVADNVSQLVIGDGIDDLKAQLIPSTDESAVVLQEVVTSTVATVSATADDYGSAYFICDTGDDANTGRTPYSPWKTYDKAMGVFKVMNAGDSINFCRGGVFNTEQTYRIYNYNCKADNKCRIGDYYLGNNINAERPKIISMQGEVIFNFQDGGNADPDGGYLIENLILESKVPGSSAIFLFNDVDDLTVRNVRMDGFNAGFHAEGTNALNEGTNGQNDRIVFENNEIVNNASQGWLGSCSDCVIRGNYFENNGYSTPVFDHNLYFSAHGANNVLIVNNVLKKSTNVDGICQGVSLVIHGVGKNITIEGNLIEEEVNKVRDVCWGIAVDTGYGTVDESFENLTIRGNTVINTGNLGIGCSSCANVLIEDNVIISENDMDFTAVAVPNRGEDTLKSSGITVKNNKVILSGISNPKRGFSITPIDSNFTLNNNQIYTNSLNAECANLNQEGDVTAEQCNIVKN